MEVEAAVVEDVVETGGCEAEEDQPHQGRSEALDESGEVVGSWKGVLEEHDVLEELDVLEVLEAE